jgi:hypothetical protein
MEIPMFPASAPKGDPSTTVTVPTSPHCANCERVLGKLENLFPWEGHDVCAHCVKQLQAEQEFRNETPNKAPLPPVLSSPSPETMPSQQLAQTPAVRPNQYSIMTELRMFAVAMLGATIGGVGGFFSNVSISERLRDRWGNPEPELFGVIGAAIGIIGPAIWFLDWHKSYRKQHPVVPNRPTSGLLPFADARQKSILTLLQCGLSCLIIAVVGVVIAIWVCQLMYYWGGGLRYIAPTITGIIAIACVVGVFDRYRLSMCPKCKFFGMAIIVSREHLATHEHYETRMQNIKVHEGYGQGGDVIANYNVPVQQRHLTTHWREFCSCKHCGHKWSRDRKATRKA